MSTIQALFRVSRTFTGQYAGNLSKNSSITRLVTNGPLSPYRYSLHTSTFFLIHRYSVCSTCRNFWTTFIRRKEVNAKENVEVPAEETQGSEEQHSVTDLLKQLEETRRSRDELNVGI